jgi:hypothetical protein
MSARSESVSRSIGPSHDVAPGFYVDTEPAEEALILFSRARRNGFIVKGAARIEDGPGAGGGLIMRCLLQADEERVGGIAAYVAYRVVDLNREYRSRLNRWRQHSRVVRESLSAPVQSNDGLYLPQNLRCGERTIGPLAEDTYVFQEQLDAPFG